MSKPSSADLSQLSAQQLDALPFGAIRLDRDGKILSYNEAESQLSGREPATVVGRSFFTEVAPCTAVRDFHGQFLDLVEHRAINRQFDFVFAFDPPVRVQITMLYEASGDTVWVLVDRWDAAKGA